MNMYKAVSYTHLDVYKRQPFTTAEDLKEKPEDFLCVPAKEIARIITLKTSGSSGNPKRLFFTEEDLLATADFFETGMQYMVLSLIHI